MKKVVIVTGELSGEVHAAHLVRALKASSDIAFSGIGSTGLRDAGVEIVHDYRDISLTGVSEVFSKAGHIWKAYRTLKRHLLDARPDLLILVDFPGFNMRIARVARRAAIPTVYFIPPQVWAWRKGRIEQIKRYIDLVLCILPFEEALYRERGIPVKYIGHPFLSTVKPVHGKDAFYAMFAIKTGSPVITLMPGSRENEVRRHMPILIEVAGRLNEALGPCTLLLPVAATVDERAFAPFLDKAPGRLIPVKGLPYDCLAYSQAALIASGSATLEAAVLGVPTVVVYKVSRLSYLIARMLVDVSHISLPNIIAGREVFPEFIQSLDAEKIANTLASMVKNERSSLMKEMEEVRRKLATPESDPYGVARAEILTLLERKRWPST